MREIRPTPDELPERVTESKDACRELAEARCEPASSEGGDSRPRILAQCSERRRGRALLAELQRAELDVSGVNGPVALADGIQSSSPDLVILPWRTRIVRRTPALEMAVQLALQREIPILALCPSAADAREALRHGVTDVVHRRLESTLIVHRVLRLWKERLERRRIEELKASRKESDERLVRAREESTKKPLVDGLTGLPSREAFEAAIRGALAAGVTPQRRMMVAILDIDRFRHVNQSCGRHRANQVLQIIAQRITSRMRSGDLIDLLGSGSVTSMVARLDGDRFGVFLGALNDSSDPRSAVEAFGQDFTRNFVLADGTEIHLTCSGGAVMAPDDGTTVEELLQNAEFAAAEAEHVGGGVIRAYASSGNRISPRLTRMSTLLVGALDREEFTIVYQPIVEARYGGVVAAEALLRWNSPEIGAISPAEFVPLAEERGLMVPIGSWVLDRSCAFLRDWLDSGLLPIRMAVNVSISQLVQQRLSRVVEDCLRKHEIPPELLELEISERGTLRSDPEILSELRAIRDLGCRLAIDDFGTGNSAVAYLKRFPVTALKIDKSFVDGVPDSEEDAAITRAIVAMARSLGLEVVAEGIETEEQWSFLREIECDDLQGFLFSRPVPPERLRELVTGQSGLRAGLGA